MVLVQLAYLQPNITYLTAHITDFTLEFFPNTTDFRLHIRKSLIHFLESLADSIFEPFHRMNEGLALLLQLFRIRFQA